MIWDVTLESLKGSYWEGGILKIELSFDEGFDEVPPRVVFLTIPFHPNISTQTGLLHHPLLHPSRWDRSLSVSSLLIMIQQILVEPIVDDNDDCKNAVMNENAAECYISKPRLFEQIVRDCMVNSRMVSVGLPLTKSLTPPNHRFQTSQPADQHAPPSSSKEPKPKVQRVNYETYFETWQSLATTVPDSGKCVFKLQNGSKEKKMGREREKIVKSLIQQVERTCFESRVQNLTKSGCLTASPQPLNEDPSGDSELTVEAQKSSFYPPIGVYPYVETAMDYKRTQKKRQSRPSKGSNNAGTMKCSRGDKLFTNEEKVRARTRNEANHDVIASEARELIKREGESMRNLLMTEEKLIETQSSLDEFTASQLLRSSDAVSPGNQSLGSQSITDEKNVETKSRFFQLPKRKTK
ncbi:ubiquitin-conjugating enzyme/RWD-like protein [Paraphysoderma sedebokerense]|nr:ubiquitin-conjugating enzyme/RWD-like protein [Paraphysoderma sedebokerense]